MPLAQLHWLSLETNLSGSSRVVSFMTPQKITRFAEWLKVCHFRIKELRDICDRKGQPINGWTWEDPEVTRDEMRWEFHRSQYQPFILVIQRNGGGLGR